jgi:hypothetical protein
MDTVYVNHIENASFSIVLFTARCILMVVIRLLPEYSLPRIVVALPSNGLFTKNLSPRERVYRVLT